MINREQHLKRLWEAADGFRPMGLQHSDSLSLLLSLYGFRVLAASASLFQKLGLKGELERHWDAIKRNNRPAESLKNVLEALAEEARLPTLQNYPQALNRLHAEQLSRIVLDLDKMDSTCDSLHELAQVGDVIDALIGAAVSRAPLGREVVTPNELNALFAELLFEGSVPSSIHDPVCGVGGSLAAFHRLLLKRGEPASEVAFSGQDIDPDQLFICTWNLLLRGIVKPRLEQANTLREPKFIDARGNLEHFDIVVANPPLNLVAPENFGGADLYQRFRYGEVRGKRSDYAFIQHVLASTKQEGRALVAVAPGALFRTGFEGDVRENLVHADVIDACIGLPSGLFQITSIPTALMLFCPNKPERLRNRLLFIDAEGTAPKGRGSPLTADLRRRILETYRSRKDQDGFAKEVTLEEVKEQDYNLLPKLYIPQPLPELPSVEALDAQIETLEKQLEDARNQFVTALSSLRN